MEVCSLVEGTVSNKLQAHLFLQAQGTPKDITHQSMEVEILPYNGVSGNTSTQANSSNHFTVVTKFDIYVFKDEE